MSGEHNQYNSAHAAELLDGKAGRLMRLATYASVSVALLLVGVKFFAWLKTDSLTILTSLIDSLLDAGVSLINLLAVRYALQPPDEDHRFGHTSAEDIASLAQAAFIAGSAMFIGIEAIGRFISPQPVAQGMFGIGVMAFSILMTGLLVLFQRYVVKQSGSGVVSADSLHYLTDLLSNAAVIVALGLVMAFDWWWADPAFALLIGGYIAWGAWKIGKRAFDNLMDREFEEEERQKIIDLVESHPGAEGLHALKTRYSGIKPFIQFHLDLDGSLSLREAHAIADELEKKIEEMFPGGEIIIHEDPAELSLSEDAGTSH